MAARQRLAGLIWAAILVVAAQLVPTNALAHAGHAHHHAAAAPTATTSDRQPVQVEETERTRPRSEVVATAEQAPPADACPTSGCTGSCCGTGVGCCGAVMPVAPLQTLPNGGRGNGLPLRRSDPRAGIDPDALGKPPKLLA